mgnify:FL=1
MGAKATDGRAYEVVAHREAYPEGSWWVFDIPALGAAGQTSRLANVAAEARAIIAAWDEDGPDEQDVRVAVRLDGEVEARRIWEQGEAEVAALREAAEAAAGAK